MNWREQALCRHEDPELFFPVGTTGPAIAQVAEAKAVCARCPVREACLQWALETNQGSGVWGGMSEDERRAYRRAVVRGASGASWDGTAARPDGERREVG